MVAADVVGSEETPARLRVEKGYQQRRRAASREGLRRRTAREGLRAEKNCQQRRAASREGLARTVCGMVMGAETVFIINLRAPQQGKLTANG